MASVKLKLATHNVHQDGTSPIYIQIIKQRTRKLINSTYSVKPEQWDAANQSVTKKHPQFQRLNNLLQQKKADAMKTLLDKETEDYDITVKQLSDHLSGKTSDYFEFAKEYLEKFNNDEQIGTYTTHHSSLNNLRQFAGDKLPFAQITLSFLRNYETHLKKKGKKVNTIWAQFKRMKAVLRAAINEGHHDPNKNPFLYYKLKTEKTVKERLTVEELQKIRDAKPKVFSKAWHAQQVFMLQFYFSGIRISDVLLLKEKDVLQRINKLQTKTGGNISIDIIEPARKIIEKYVEEKKKRKIKSEYIIPLVTKGKKRKTSSGTSIVNAGLIKLTEMCGIEKHLSSHCARHTFSNIAKKKIKDVHTISQLLGHSNIKITQVYLADLDNDELDAANKLVTTI